MTQEQGDKTALLVLGETPTEVCRRLNLECQAFAEHVEQREQDWQKVQSGRDWSPAQEVEHVILTSHSVGRVIRLLLSDKELQPIPKISGQKKDGKRQAPDMILPSREGLPWAEYKLRWQQSVQEFQDVAARVRSTPERTFWHPFLGDLDALEWLRMNTWHIGHHRQLMEQSLIGGSV